jgi:hypothetical protein
MTIEQWWMDLIDPTHLLTEGIYNVLFELVATYIFVRFALKGMVRKLIEEQNKQDSENL